MFQEPGGACRSRRAGGSRSRGGNYLAADRKALVCIQRLLSIQSVFAAIDTRPRSEEHTSELQSRLHLVCRLLLETKKTVEFRIAAHALDESGYAADRIRNHRRFFGKSLR